MTVLSLTSRGRLGFRRSPVPHFVFSFVEEPAIHIEVDSLFQGRSFPQLNSIILNQVCYLRNTPFFAMVVVVCMLKSPTRTFEDTAVNP